MCKRDRGLYAHSLRVCLCTCALLAESCTCVQQHSQHCHSLLACLTQDPPRPHPHPHPRRTVSELRWRLCATLCLCEWSALCFVRYLRVCHVPACSHNTVYLLACTLQVTIKCASRQFGDGECAYARTLFLLQSCTFSKHKHAMCHSLNNGYSSLDLRQSFTIPTQSAGTRKALVEKLVPRLEVCGVNEQRRDLTTHNTLQLVFLCVLLLLTPSPLFHTHTRSL